MNSPQDAGGWLYVYVFNDSSLLDSIRHLFNWSPIKKDVQEKKNAPQDPQNQNTRYRESAITKKRSRVQKQKATGELPTKGKKVVLVWRNKEGHCKNWDKLELNKNDTYNLKDMKTSQKRKNE